MRLHMCDNKSFTVIQSLRNKGETNISHSDSKGPGDLGKRKLEDQLKNNL